jgi:uncharacterized OB-fold protein
VSATAALPTGAGLSAHEFFAAVRAGRLVVQRCADCGALAVPPKAVCPACEGQRWEPAGLAGTGEVASFTVIRVAPAQFVADAPYVVAVVRMAEGVSLLGRVAGIPPESARIGMAVEFAGSPPQADPPFILFRPR